MTRCAVLIIAVAAITVSGCRSDSSKAVTLTAGNFEEKVLKSKMPVLVDFWFADCPPCRQMAPIISELAVEQEGRAVVAKLNKDDYPEIARKYEIEAYPTFILFKDGQEKRRYVGLRPKHFLSDLLGAMQ